MNETDIKRTNKSKNGKWKEFNKHAVLIAEGHYVNNAKHGLWREYYDSGELAIEQNYIHGILHGPYASYHMNGQLWSEGYHVNNQCEGTFKVYDETGLLTKLLVFENGRLTEERDMRNLQHLVPMEKVMIENSEKN